MFKDKKHLGKNNKSSKRHTSCNFKEGGTDEVQ